MADTQHSRTLLWVVIGGGAFVVFLLAVFALVYFSVRSDQKSSGFGGFGDKIGVVDLEGVIIQPKDVVKQLKKFGEDDSIKAIILHVNTPGGGVAASEEIYQAVKRVRDKKKKPIIAAIETVGASGGYYVSSATNRIFADHGSVVGSIGVIAEWYNYGDLLHWAKMKDVVFKTGEFKDTGNPTRELSPAEREYLQNLINSMYAQFIHAVAEGRNLKEDQVRSFADGRVWTGEQAQQMHLVDELGDMQAAVDYTAKSVGIKGEPTLVRAEKEKKTVLDLLFGDVSDYLPDRTKLMQTQVGFYYLWK
ncbi:MAG: signal peptide peptidase SppA [Acidobacteriaceae bacterium]|nr:signal peptide peptidase SppA [Acidobacteriaceae bacterium]